MQVIGAVLVVLSVSVATISTAFAAGITGQFGGVAHAADDVMVKARQYDNEKNCSTDTSKIPNPVEYLTYFNCGNISVDDNGTVTRHFTLIAEEGKKIAVSDQNNFEAWTFNGTIPGPTMRVTEGDRVQITLINSNESEHPHSLHMHSIHPAGMDGVDHPIMPGQHFTYDFIARPFGVFPYHCHVEPIETHINRGLYGMLIIDPKEPRPHANEMVMLMNGYDLNQTDEGKMFMLPKAGEVKADNPERSNDIYTVNGKAFVYADNPINIKVNQPVRIYLVNMLEFDLVNSFHLHGNVFQYYPSGTSMTAEQTNDIVTLSQGDRGIIEFKPQYTGKYMFHAHQTEFTELGWMGYFNVTK